MSAQKPSNTSHFPSDKILKTSSHFQFHHENMNTPNASNSTSPSVATISPFSYLDFTSYDKPTNVFNPVSCLDQQDLTNLFLDTQETQPPFPRLASSNEIPSFLLNTSSDSTFLGEYTSQIDLSAVLAQDIKETENRICALPDDLLLQILLHVPTKDAVATAILSKRWRNVWTMLPELEFKDEGSESVGWFIEKSLELHKAPKLDRLSVELGPRCPVDLDVGKWVENAINRYVNDLNFKLLWTAGLTSLPKSLYTCHTLVDLTLSNQILVDISSPARLPSLLYLSLLYVVYKDEDSLVRLLSSSPILENLTVERHEHDNLKNFTVKVSTLKILDYTTWPSDEEVEEEDDDDHMGTLVIDSPALIDIFLLAGSWEDYCLIENIPCLDEAYIAFVPHCDDKFLRSISSVRYLHLTLTQSMVGCCNAIRFSRLVKFYFCPVKSVDWLEPLMILLKSSPKLKTLMINTEPGALPPSWKQPSSTIPGCLSSHLEIFGWKDYAGREEEKQLVRYILANSKSLKTVEISLIATCKLEETQKEIESMPRISTSYPLLFPANMEYSFYGTTSSCSCY